MPIRIKSFHGDAAFLSNFCLAQVFHDGIDYPTTEHAFQAAKTLDFHQRYEISKIETPGQAKRAGRKVQLRPDWEQVKNRIMWELTVLKFTNHPNLKKLLLATGNAELIEGNTERLRRVRMDASQRKARTQPLNARSAGCTFRNPEGESAGRLIDRLGLKGLTRGEAEVSTLHGNFIVNRGGATPSDILGLMDEVRAKVFKAHGITLEPELRLIA